MTLHVASDIVLLLTSEDRINIADQIERMEELLSKIGGRHPIDNKDFADIRQLKYLLRYGSFNNATTE